MARSKTSKRAQQAGASSRSGPRALWILLFTALPLLVGSLWLIGDALRIDSPGITEERQLTGSRDSTESLARYFLEVLEEGDRQRIKSMAVSREEFEQYVWPSLPASQPGSGLTSEWVYNQSLLRSLGGFEKVMGWHAGREYEFRDIRIDGGVKQYQGFTIHDDPVLSITDERGKAREIQLFGSIIERDGEFKIYSFNLD